MPNKAGEGWEYPKEKYLVVSMCNLVFKPEGSMVSRCLVGFVGAFFSVCVSMKCVIWDEGIACFKPAQLLRLQCRHYFGN